MIGHESLALACPIAAEGLAAGYNREHAMLGASRAIYDVALVLGVAWGLPFELIHSPQPLPPGLLDLPDSATVGVPDHVREGVVTAETREVPSWGASALEAVVGQPGWRSILAAYREGQLLFHRHPSMALIAFVAAVDGLGRLLFPGEGNRVRFERALELAMSKDQLLSLMSGMDLYGLRSETAHEGTLHGQESILGAFYPPTFLTGDPAWTFSNMTVNMFGSVVRDLLEKLLSGDLPLRLVSPADP